MTVDRAARNAVLLLEIGDGPQRRAQDDAAQIEDHGANVRQGGEPGSVAGDRTGSRFPHLWIAAGAMEHSLRVVTLDDHFRQMPQIVVDYFDPDVEWSR